MNQIRLYEYNGKYYYMMHETKVKINGLWRDAIVYRCCYDNTDGMIWVRLIDDFIEKFKPVL